MNLLKLVAKIILDGSGFKAGMKEVQKIGNDTASKLTKDFKTALAGYFGYEAAKAMSVRVMQSAVRLRQLSEAFGVTTDEVQKLDKAGFAAGKTFEDFGTAMDRGGANRKRAIEESRELRETWARYGITLDDLLNPQLQSIDLMKKMAGAIKGMRLTAEDRENFRELWGKSAPQLLQILRDWDPNKKISLMEKEQIDRLFEADKALKQLKRSYDIWASPGLAKIGAFLTGGAALLDPKFRSHQAELEEFFKANQYSGDANIRKLHEQFRHGMGTPIQDEEFYERVKYLMNARAGNGVRDISAIKDVPLADEAEKFARDKLAGMERVDAEKAETALIRTILEGEIRRKGVVEEIRQLKKEIAAAESDAAKYAESAKTNEIDRAFVADRRNDAEKARQRLLEITKLRGGAADSETARGNVIGSLARLRYFETLGGAGGVGGDPIPKQQLSVAQAQRVLLQRIAEARVASAVFAQ